MGTNTGIGIGIGIPFKNNVLGEGKPYLSPEVKEALKAVVIAYGKTNNDSDRAVVKNLVDASNPFIISNAAYKLNSGYGLYGMDFLEWKSNSGMSFTSTKLTSTKPNLSGGWLTFRSVSGLIPETKVKVSGAPREFVFIGNNNGADDKFSVTINNGVYTIPEFTLSSASGFYINNNRGDWSNLVIEQIPSFEGAFVTDGIDDLIKSTKSATEMLDGSNEVTVVSMIHQIKTNDDTTRNNWFFTPVSYLENRVVKDKIGKTGIYGYTSTNVTNAQISDITPILGDKNDYTLYSKIEDGDRDYFTVEGFQNQGIWYASSVAWYWTIIANKVLTTDQINQVIAYFNLDRTLNPDILCYIEKQGITNENHAEFGDKLIDFSGNGRDIQLNNIAWNKESGIDDNGALCLDGVDDYGKVTGMPVYKDYTVVTDREIFANIGAISSKNNPGAFVETAGNSVYSFGQATSGLKFISTRSISYLSKYSYCEQSITAGAAEDGTDMWLGTIRDNDSRFLNGAIYSLMSFPYSMSEFLIERQLKKHKLGTLYPDMVEFRPVIKKDDRIKSIKYYIDGKIANIGQYYPIGSGLGIAVKTVQPYMVKSLKVNGVNTIPNADYKGFNARLDSKSPQKITMDIQVDTNLIQWNPIITSTAELTTAPTFAIRGTSTLLKAGDWIPKNSEIWVIVTMNNLIDELRKFSFNGTFIHIPSSSYNPDTGKYGFPFVIDNESPQNINLTIDEYIRYEDIVQPYPILLGLRDENDNEVSWGDKLRVGSTATFTRGLKDSDLLYGMYKIDSIWLNNENMIVVADGRPLGIEKKMEFRSAKEWLLDNNEPKCILSPRLLNIPNSSYKILGYIPDISGNGNHGVIHNSAYAEGSGVNEDGSYQFDGVDDHITIPTLSSGGKQVLMKVNWDKTIADAILYDQRGYPNEFAIYNADVDNYNNPVFAYQARNNGQTYIDGILNKNIKASELRAITHNITITNELSTGTNTSSPVIGSNRVHDAYFTNMALYDFMLFDEISTDDKIKELNEYVGVEAKIELPPYYWDAYGKTNSDADRDSIQQRGVTIGDYDLTNYNHAYDKMSGYGGYDFEKFTDTTKWIETKREDGIEVIEKNDYSFTAKKVGTGQYFWDFKNNSIRTLDKELTVKAISNNNVYIRWEFKYRTAKKPDTDSSVILVRQAMTPNVPITVILPYKTQEEQTELGVVEGSAYYLFYFDPSDIPVGDEYTVEMLPLYPNGLVYDGITDYSKNANIPALDDFTAIIKREWLKKQGCPLIKGSKVYEGGNGNALLLEWDKAYNFVFYKRTDIMKGELPDNISFITPTNYNGNVITRGSEQDTNGICIAGDGNAGFANMIFYKLILYPKTIPLLQINFLKNLMERDEIIDLTNPIFIKDE